MEGVTCDRNVEARSGVVRGWCTQLTACHFLQTPLSLSSSDAAELRGRYLWLWEEQAPCERLLKGPQSQASPGTGWVFGKGRMEEVGPCYTAGSTHGESDATVTMAIKPGIHVPQRQQQHNSPTIWMWRQDCSAWCWRGQVRRLPWTSYLPLKGPLARESPRASRALKVRELEQKQRHGDGQAPVRAITFE